MARPSAFRTKFEETADRVTVALDALIPRADGPEARLISAMRYAALGGGKRLRPFFALECGRLFEVDERSLLRAAAALECVHTYSLVHDDLPAMDDDDLRRGRPTVHKAYDEATAVLAGDALLTLAFEILAHPDTHGAAHVRSELISRLALAAGARGMAGGQMIDLTMGEEEEEADISIVTRMQRMKTGALISFTAEIGPVIARASEDVHQSMAGFAHDLGLAYQIADDLLDAEGDAGAMGKAAGKDNGQGKATFVSILGPQKAREQARMLADQAKSHLDPFGERADLLREAVDFVIHRSS